MWPVVDVPVPPAQVQAYVVETCMRRPSSTPLIVTNERQIDCVGRFGTTRYVLLPTPKGTKVQVSAEEPLMTPQQAEEDAQRWADGVREEFP
jgi:hypothetical protein